MREKWNNIVMWSEIGMLYLLGVFLIILSLIVIPIHFVIKSATGKNMFSWYKNGIIKTVNFIEDRYGKA